MFENQNTQYLSSILFRKLTIYEIMGENNGWSQRGYG